MSMSSDFVIPSVDGMERISTRLLDAQGTNSTNDENRENVTHILQDSMRIYGSIFICGFIVYCYFRKRIPRIFAVRQWIPEHTTPLAQDQFGYISWMWKVYSFSEEQLLETIGLDALCFLSVLNMGFRLSCFGCVISIVLIPVYATSDRSQDYASFEEDPAQDTTIRILPGGSPRFVATILAAYFFFGYTMYSIQKDFRWFIEKRHAWMKRFNARNYTILIRNIPEVLRSDQLLKEYFQRLCGHDSVLEAHVCMHISRLKLMVKKRAKCILRLEHALAVLAIHGKRPKHLLVRKAASCSVRNTNERFEVDAIDHFTGLLKALNEKIDEQISMIERRQHSGLVESNHSNSDGEPSDSFRESQGILPSDENMNGENKAVIFVTADRSREAMEADGSLPTATASVTSTAKIVFANAPRLASSLASGTASTLSGAGRAIKRKAIKRSNKRLKQALSSVSATVDMISSAILSEEDGTPDDAGFVAFTSLVATHCALQMLQHSEPLVLDAVAAPDEPRHVSWGNVGKDKEVLKTGRLLSYAVTVFICLFWTFVVTFIVNLQNVGDGFLGSEDAPPEWLQQLLALLSPLLLLIFNTGLLPIILKAVSRLECPASGSLLEASAFWKMATFTIVQTFFVTLLSGSIIDAVPGVFTTPIEFIKLIAEALPKQSGYFMQIIIVSTCVGPLLELFRVIPLVQSVARTNLGRRLTEKERNITVGMLRPLSGVDKIYFSRLQARFPLYFLILFVYTVITPIVTWFCLALFLVVGSVYRYQFVFNYPNTPDSGGAIWLYGVRVLLACLVIAELMVIGLMSVEGERTYAYLTIPLFVVTCLFINNLDQYFKVAKSLPVHLCLDQDLVIAADRVSFDEFRNKYKDPALMERYLDADWNSGMPCPSQATIVFATDNETGEGQVDEKSDSAAIEEQKLHVEGNKDNNAGAC